ncbi:putative G-protein coupled receptor 83 [Sarcoptes scabiei]|uniref:Putative G-protein coupled receptor 83 n=1 Tax=Sarcoptes scabiei TaxID=52283 RepID=A0A834RGD2_SARSC|nr:putative G-protein coupled receptor 83 [Sarcoptes scabiei]
MSNDHHHVLILNLAISDLLLTCFNIPINIVRFVSTDWPFGAVICTLTPFIQSLSAHCNSVTMMVIAFERYKSLIGLSNETRRIRRFCSSFCFRQRKNDKFECDPNQQQLQHHRSHHHHHLHHHHHHQQHQQQQLNLEQSSIRSESFQNSSPIPSQAPPPPPPSVLSPLPSSSSPPRSPSWTTMNDPEVKGKSSTVISMPVASDPLPLDDHHRQYDAHNHYRQHNQSSNITNNGNQSSKTIISRSKQSSWKRLISLIWICSILLSIPHCLFNRVVVYPSLIEDFQALIRCATMFPNEESRVLLSILSPLSQYFLPIGLTALFYARIGCFLWRRTDPIGFVSEGRRMSILKRKRKRVKMLVIVVAVFATCWFPLHLYVTLIDFQIIQHHFGIYFVTHWIAMSSVCYNPFIYCWLNETFRHRIDPFIKRIEAVKNFLCCLPLRKNQKKTIDTRSNNNNNNNNNNDNNSNDDDDRNGRENNSTKSNDGKKRNSRNNNNNNHNHNNHSNETSNNNNNNNDDDNGGEENQRKRQHRNDCDEEKEGSEQEEEEIEYRIDIESHHQNNDEKRKNQLVKLNLTDSKLS